MPGLRPTVNRKLLKTWNAIRDTTMPPKASLVVLSPGPGMPFPYAVAVAHRVIVWETPVRPPS